MDLSSERIPSLVMLCQRVAANNLDHIWSFGDELDFDIVDPILLRCTVEQLVRVEQTTPRIRDHTQHIWERLCFKRFVREARQCTLDHPEGPECWRAHYSMLAENETVRLAEAANRLRSKREQADELKKEHQVKIVQAPKRAKPSTGSWGAFVPKKTLFQKTKTEASKLQKSIYTTRMNPIIMAQAKDYRQPIVRPPPGNMLPPSAAVDPSRVTVNTVKRRAQVSSGSRSQHDSRSATVSTVAKPVMIKKAITAPIMKSSIVASAQEQAGSPRPVKSLPSGKRDPMAALFMPKQRAYSQRVG